MLGKDRKMQIMVTAEVDRYNPGGIANKGAKQYKTLVQEYMEGRRESCAERRSTRLSLFYRAYSTVQGLHFTGR